MKFITLILLAALPLAGFSATPVFEASSESFELVGRIKDKQLVLSLDRWASNEPVAGATVEVEHNGATLVATPLGEGSYAVDAAPFAKPASYPLTITITAGDDADLLAAELKVEADAADAAGDRSLNTLAAAIAGGALLAGAYFVRRRKGGTA